jgi:uncharacterized RDD family membrane protein YckC
MTTDEKLAAESALIAGVRPRLLALLLDGLVLGLIGALLGLFLFDVLTRIGGWGRAFGFAIALVYSGMMNSGIYGGQTLGKMAMKIKVVSSTGAPLSVAASFGRSGILEAPYFLYLAPLPPDLWHSWLAAVVMLLVFGVGLSVPYLFFFNRSTRQSLHDLAVGSYVVRTGGEAVPVLAGTVWRGHYVVVAALMMLAAAMPMVTGALEKREPFASLVSLQEVMANEPGVRYVTLEVNTSSTLTIGQGAQTTTSLFAQVIADSKDIDQEALANRIARIALDRYGEASNKDAIVVTIRYGYDIGIASSWRYWRSSFSPAEWRARL